MRDTSPSIEREMQARLKLAGGVERLKMGCSMFDMAKELALASFPPCGPQEKRRLFFLRFYGSDFAAERRDRILAYFSEKPRRL